MTPFDTEKLSTFPKNPGVYLMKDKAGKILYVGKAKNLQNRLRQYFISKSDTREMIPYLLASTVTVDTIVVSNEKEALLLENTLIKRHSPKYNALLKDDKSYISLMINHKHKWPMIKLVRTKDSSSEKGLFFGPYTSAYAARHILDLLQSLFPLRQCSDIELKTRARPCLLYGIKKCIAPCTNQCTKEEYDEFVKGAIDFLKGNDEKLVSHLEEEREKASAALEFEKAGAFNHTIEQIKKITRSDQVVFRREGADTDVLALYGKGRELLLAQLLLRDGKLIGSEHFSFSGIAAEDEELLSSFLLQHYASLKEPPQQILLPIPLADSKTIEEILLEATGKKISLLHPERGRNKALLSLAEENAKTLFIKERSGEEVREKLLLDLQEELSLTHYPRRIECFDISHFSGGESVASLVAFTDGKKETKRTRLYKIEGITQSDDYGAMRQVLTRRLTRAKEENDLPDLLIVDGGKGQLSSALEVLKLLDIASLDLIALTKEEGRHDKGLSEERVFLQDTKEPIHLPPRSPLLFFLQQIRDESHRLALSFQKKRRGKELIKSALDDVPGIGPIKKARLLQTFGSVASLKKASDEELLAVPGITKKDLTAIKDFFTK